MKLTVVSFSPHPSQSIAAIATTSELREEMAAFQEESNLYVWLDHPDTTEISLLVGFNPERAWVGHLDNVSQSGGDTPDSYAYQWVDEIENPDDYLEFLLDNGQVQRVHRLCTVSHADALQALSYFVEHQERDPALQWHHALDLW